MAAPDSRGKRSDRGWGDFLKVFGPALILTVAGFALAYVFVEPAPPRSFTIATGREDGAYHRYALSYRDILARDGITLNLKGSSGSLENLDLLSDPGSGVEAAFVQGGIAEPAGADDLRALASLYYEPLWIFARGATPPVRLPELTGLRLAIGAEGSGTRAVALQLLADNGLAEGAAELLPLGGMAAVEALAAGEVDAAFFVASATASFIARLLETPGIAPVSLARAEAYARRYRHFSHLSLPEGVIDFADNLPSRDVELLAPAATLVARDDLHPALIVLLLQAAAEVHSEGGLFEEPGAFPSRRYLDLPLHETAQRYFDAGPPFLQRFLPFWAADLIDRLKILLLPLITLMIPLFRIVPPTYRWRIRSRIYRWYRELQAIDDALGEAAAADDAGRLRAELDRIEAEVKQVTVPLSYADALYHLRLHIDFVRRRLPAGGDG